VHFERGGGLVIELFDDLAPRNCEEVWQALPLEVPMFHAIFSGHGLFAKVPNFPVAEENQQIIGIPPGSLGIEYFPAWLRSPAQRTGLALTYGSVFQFRNPFTVSYPLSIIGRATSTDGLMEIGERIWASGKERITLERGG
jgi:hypothetical protein